MFTPGLRRADIEKALGPAFAGAIPNNYRIVREAIDRGIPLEEVKPGNNVSVAMKKLIVPQAALKTAKKQKAPVENRSFFWARGIEPACRHCAAGWAQNCLNLGAKTLTPGLSLGYTSDLGGGWAEQVVGHASMLHPLPDGVPDAGASLHEPTSIAVHGLLRRPPRDGDQVVVVGAGIIGLCVLATLRHLFPASEVTVLARHDHQADAARAIGARHVVRPEPDGSHFERLAEISDAQISGRGGGLMLMGGFPYVVEAVGAPASVTEALRIVDNRGTVLLLGAAGMSEVDLTQVWFKEAALVGAWGHCVDGTRHAAVRERPDPPVPPGRHARGRHHRARPQGHRRDQGHAPSLGRKAKQPPE